MNTTNFEEFVITKLNAISSDIENLAGMTANEFKQVHGRIDGVENNLNNLNQKIDLVHRGLEESIESLARMTADEFEKMRSPVHSY